MILKSSLEQLTATSQCLTFQTILKKELCCLDQNLLATAQLRNNNKLCSEISWWSFLIKNILCLYSVIAHWQSMRIIKDSLWSNACSILIVNQSTTFVSNQKETKSRLFQVRTIRRSKYGQRSWMRLVEKKFNSWNWMEIFAILLNIWRSRIKLRMLMKWPTWDEFEQWSHRQTIKFLMSFVETNAGISGSLIETIWQLRIFLNVMKIKSLLLL